MLQELAKETGAAGWAIASMLFFLVLWLVIALATWRARHEAMDHRARLPFDGDEERDKTRES